MSSASAIATALMRTCPRSSAMTASRSGSVRRGCRPAGPERRGKARLARGWGGRGVRARRSRAAIGELVVAGAPAPQPLAGARLAEPGGLGRRPQRPALLLDALTHQAPRRRTRLGVL